MPARPVTKGMKSMYPCFGVDGMAEEMGAYYASIFPNSQVDFTMRARGEISKQSGLPEGSVVGVQLRLDGNPLFLLNGASQEKANMANSLVYECQDQATLDRVWDGLLKDGGQAIQCGWLLDKYGFAWQVIPHWMFERFQGEDQDAARRLEEQMLQMVKLDFEPLETAYKGSA